MGVMPSTRIASRTLCDMVREIQYPKADCASGTADAVAPGAHDLPFSRVRPRRAAAPRQPAKTSLGPRLGLWQTALGSPTIGRGRLSPYLPGTCAVQAMTLRARKQQMGVGRRLRSTLSCAFEILGFFRNRRGCLRLLVFSPCGSALQLICGEQWHPPCSGRACTRSCYPSERPGKVLRASGIVRSSSRVTGKDSRAVSALGSGALGAYPRA
jgi:hypothetical protein